MAGRSLASKRLEEPAEDALLPEEEELIRERLSGLGYIA
jgi:hypothetical protein